MIQQQLRRARDQRDDGFTLIELLIVIVVLGVLAGIVVFGVSTFRSDSVRSACRADIKTVQVAVDAFFAKNGRYPDGIGSATDGNVNTLVRGGYLKAAPPATEYTISYTNGTPPVVAGAVNGGGGNCVTP